MGAVVRQTRKTRLEVSWCSTPPSHRNWSGQSRGQLLCSMGSETSCKSPFLKAWTWIDREKTHTSKAFFCILKPMEGDGLTRALRGVCGFSFGLWSKVFIIHLTEGVDPHLPGDAPMVPGMAAEVCAAKFQFFFQFLVKLLGWWIKDVLLLRELQRKRDGRTWISYHQVYLPEIFTGHLPVKGMLGANPNLDFKHQWKALKVKSIPSPHKMIKVKKKDSKASQNCNKNSFKW